MCNFKVLERQVSLSTLFGTLRVYIKFLFWENLMVLKDPHLKSCERIYTIDFSLFPKIKSLDIFVEVY